MKTDKQAYTEEM